MVFTKIIIRKRLGGISLISFIVVCSLVGLFSSSVVANLPSEMMLSYESVTQTLEVSITHQVSNPDVHYIYNIVIKNNGEIVSTNNYTTQPSSTSFTYSYDINATKGDVVTVVANCIQGGLLSSDLTVATGGAFSDNGSSTPGFGLITLLTSIAILFFLFNKEKVN